MFYNKSYNGFFDIDNLEYNILKEKYREIKEELSSEKKVINNLKYQLRMLSKQITIEPMEYDCVKIIDCRNGSYCVVDLLDYNGKLFKFTNLGHLQEYNSEIFKDSTIVSEYLSLKSTYNKLKTFYNEKLKLLQRESDFISEYRYLTSHICVRCKSSDGNLTYDPYMSDMYGIKEKVVLCSDCYSDSLGDI